MRILKATAEAARKRRIDNEDRRGNEVKTETAASTMASSQRQALCDDVGYLNRNSEARHSLRDG